MLCPHAVCTCPLWRCQFLSRFHFLRVPKIRPPLSLKPSFFFCVRLPGEATNEDARQYICISIQCVRRGPRGFLREYALKLYLGAKLGRPRAKLGRLGRSWASSRAMCAPSWAVRAPSWAFRVPSWTPRRLLVSKVGSNSPSSDRQDPRNRAPVQAPA